MNTLDFVLLLIMAVFCLFAISSKFKNIIPKSSLIHPFNKGIRFIINKYYILITIAVFALAIFIRSYKFGMIPYGFNQDEAMAALEGLTLSKYGTDHYGMSLPVYFTAWRGSQMNVLLSYIMIPFLKIFGVSIFTARLPALIFSLISLWVLYRFSYRLWGRNVALSILFVMALNPWQIMMSRWALEANLFPHLILYGLYLLWLGIEKRKIHLFFSMIIFGTAMYSYGISYYAVPLLLLVLCIYLLCIKKIKFTTVMLCFVTYMAVAWPIFLMIYVNYTKHETINIGLMTIPFFENGQRMNDVLFFSEGNVYQQFISNFFCVMNAAIFQNQDLLWNSIPKIGPMYFCTIPLFITGLVMMFKKYFSKEASKEKRMGYFFILTFFTVAFASGLITNYVNINRVNMIFFPMIIFIGYAIYQICRRYNFTVIIVVMIFAMLFTNFSKDYFEGEHSEALGKEFYYGYSDALEYVKDKDFETLYITSYTQGEYAYFVSEIMALYILDIDNKYYSDETDSYESRYVYGVEYFFVDDTNPRKMYVIEESEMRYFDESRFDFYKFGSYYAVINKDL